MPAWRINETELRRTPERWHGTAPGHGARAIMRRGDPAASDTARR
jgi:hypothetical protein